MGEREFVVKNPQSDPKAPSFSRLMIDAIRGARKEHPVVDGIAGMIPGMGELQAAQDVSDPDASALTKGMAVAGMVPFVRFIKAMRELKPAGTMIKDLSPLDTHLINEVAKAPEGAPFPMKMGRMDHPDLDPKIASQLGGAQRVGDVSPLEDNLLAESVLNPRSRRLLTGK